MNRYLLLLALPLIVGCGDDDDEGETPDPITTQVSPVTPVSAGEDQQLTVTYTDAVALSGDARSKVVIDPKGQLKDIQVAADARTLQLTVVLPDPGVSYTVSVALGCVTRVSDQQPVAGVTITVDVPGETEAPVQQDVDADKAGIANAPVNPDATQAAKDLFKFLRDNYGKQIITAAMSYVEWNYTDAELVKKQTGKYPKIACHDFEHIFTHKAKWDNQWWVVPYGLDVPSTEPWAQAGGFTGASWHWEMPATQAVLAGTASLSAKGATANDLTTVVTPKDVLTEGSKARAWRDEDYKLVADHFLRLQEKGIAVLWRPFHEASGNTISGGQGWFWWAKGGPDDYKKLWVDMYDYMKAAGVNNLVWVWTTQTGYINYGKGDQLKSDPEWYPGDAYVDVVGVDIYGKPDNRLDTDCQRLARIYAKAAATFPGKMITLSECGTVPPLSEQWAAGAKWSYAMPWYGTEKATSLANHPNANSKWWDDAMSVGIAR